MICRRGSYACSTQSNGRGWGGGGRGEGSTPKIKGVSVHGAGYWLIFACLGDLRIGFFWTFFPEEVHSGPKCLFKVIFKSFFLPPIFHRSRSTSGPSQSLSNRHIDSFSSLPRHWVQTCTHSVKQEEEQRAKATLKFNSLNSGQTACGTTWAGMVFVQNQKAILIQKICGSHSTCNTEVFSIHCGHLVHPICLQVAWLWHACALLLVYSSGLWIYLVVLVFHMFATICTTRNGLKTIREWASKMQTHFEDNARAVVSRSAFCPSDKGWWRVTQLRHAATAARTHARCRCEP